MNDEKPKGGRKATGTVVPTRDGLWQAVVTLADGSRRRINPPFPKGTSKAYAKERAKFWSEDAQKRGIVKGTSESDEPASGGAAWWREYFAFRESKGLTPVRDLYDAHIAPVLGDKPPTDWTPADCEAVRDALDVKIAAGEWRSEKGRRYRFGWKRAWNAWALFTSACKAASRSKNKALRVRTDNPCNGIEPPDRGDNRQKQWLYPAEFSKLIADASLPLRWRRLYALLVYTYLRPNELTALQWKDVDVDVGVLHVTKAWDYKRDRLKEYPKSAAGVRYVPIDPELRPLLVALREGSEPDELVVPSMPPPEDWAATLRVHLERAGVERASLFENSATVKQMTLYDLRATGITWRTLRGDDARHIQQAAGHERYSTTEGYVRSAEVFRGRVGTPFPPLPGSLIAPELRSQNRSHASQVRETVASRTGFEPVLQP
jgi:integrase